MGTQNGVGVVSGEGQHVEHPVVLVPDGDVESCALVPVGLDQQKPDDDVSGLGLAHLWLEMDRM